MELGLFGLPVTLWYPVLALGFFLIMVTLVPKDRMKHLFAYGVIFGVLLDALFLLTMQTLGLFQYHHHGAFTWIGVPVSLSLAWAAALVTFLNFLPPRAKPLLYWGYLVGMATMASMLSTISNHLGALEYILWSPLMRFVVAFFWFWGTAAAYKKYGSAHDSDSPASG